MYNCKKCGKEFEKRQAFLGHCSSHNRGESYKEKRKSLKSNIKIKYNGTDLKCKFCEKNFKSGKSLGGHVSSCNMNPDIHSIKEKRIKSITGKKLSDDSKKKISNSMIKAHDEGRAWNIGKSRWNSKKSYPEEFFFKVIENEFENKKFINEYPIGIYSIDFAWPDLKKAIEIDGEQHQRFIDYIERDIRKDEYLKQNGWKILRIKWKDIFNNSKEWIKISYDFIHY
jgi:very-short-patch-repair endonuclease